MNRPNTASEEGFNYRTIEDYVAQNALTVRDHLDSCIDSFLLEIDQNRSPEFEQFARNVLHGIDSIRKDRPRPVAFAWRAYNVGQLIAVCSLPHTPVADVGGIIDDSDSKDQLHANIFYGVKRALNESPTYSGLIRRYKHNIDPDNEEPDTIDLFAGLSLLAMNRTEYQQAKNTDMEKMSQEAGNMAVASAIEWDKSLEELLRG